MCGRFALNLNADELEQSARHWVPDVTWRESPPPPEPDEPATPEPGPSRQREHGFRPNNLNVAPSTSYPVIYCPEVSEGSSASKLGKPVLQAMRWGLQPHWLKEKPDYSSAMKTINARDDTILQGGMWKSMRHRHRCVVPVLGFYEWLKKGSDKLPHFTKRTDDQLMCFAGLWDVVHFEDDPEPTYSFTIVTTDSNSQLKFLHNRMPVILPDQEAINRWLDVSSGEFDAAVSKLMVPFQGKLQCYQVPKEVGKVGNQSEDFIKPLSERKGSIQSFFAKAAAKSPSKGSPSSSPSKASPTKSEAGSPSSKRKKEDSPDPVLDSPSKKARTEIKNPE